MPDLKLVVPRATRNLITNPSIETNTDGWTIIGSSAISQSFDRGRFGVASLQVVTDGVGENEGVFFRVKPDTSNLRYWGSVYLRGEGKVRVRLKDQFNGDERSSKTITLNDTRWQRIEVTGLTGSQVSDDLRLYIETDDVMQAITFYVDGAQIEQGDYPTTYCDGDQDGCRWNIVKHDSESSRDAQERSGGRVVDITDEFTYVTVISGVGMPGLRNSLQDYPFTDGAFFQRTKVLPRVIDIVFNWKDDEAQARFGDDSLERLHELKQTLIDYIKPDLVRDSQAFMFIYEDEGRPEMRIFARYDSGLESNYDIRNKYFDFATLRLLAEDPFWSEDTAEVYNLDFADVLGFDYYLGRVDGEWINMGESGSTGGAIAPFPGAPAVALHPDGRIFYGRSGHSGGQVDIWDGETLTQNVLGTFTDSGGGTFEGVQGLAFAPNGDLYIVGQFDSHDTFGAIHNIAKWDGSSISAVGAGLNDYALQVAVALSGDVYITGNFDDVQGGGGNTMNFIGKWDGNAWQAIGQNAGLNNIAYGIDITPDDNDVYVAGVFADEYGSPGTNLNGVARYDVADDAFNELDNGLTPTTSGWSVHVASDGTVYIGGAFTGVGSEPASARGIAQWTGSAWNTLAGGLLWTPDPGTTIAASMASDSQGRLWVTGVFDQSADGIDITDFIAIWNGSSWVSVDADFLSGQSGFSDILVDANEDVYISTGLSGGPGFPPQNEKKVAHRTTVDNPGTTIVRPSFKVSGPGHIRWIENQSTRSILFLDYDLVDGETLTIDTDRRTVISSRFGSVLQSLLPVSDFGSFILLPGDNLVAVLMTEDISGKVQIAFEPRHWSVDAIGV